MHDVRVAFDLHEVHNLYAADLADASQVVPAEIHEHHVLGPFFGVREKILSQQSVFLGVRATLPGPGDGPGHHPAAFHPDQRLR